MDDKLVELEILSLSMDADSVRPSIVLTESVHGKCLIVPLGPAEASLLIMFLEGLLPAKPLTHDLIVSFWEKHGYVPKKIVFYEKEGDFYSCRLVYTDGKCDYEMETRASDAMILSVRAKIPVYANEQVMKHSLERSDIFQKGPALSYKTGFDGPQIH